MIKTSEYKGHQVLKLMRSEDDQYPISFGVAKAKLILAHIDEIKTFVDKNDKPYEPAPITDRPMMPEVVAETDIPF